MFSRSSIRRAVQFTKTSRSMSSGHSVAEIQGEVLRWQKFTAGMVALSVVAGVYNFVGHVHHHQEKTDLPYLKIRNKPFPWDCSDCSLFDTKCCRAAEEEAREKAAH